MTSLRTKLFINISFLGLFIVLVSWGLSTFVLEQFYVWHKKQSLIESSQAIDARYNSDHQNLSLDLERIASNLGASILILGPDGYFKYGSFQRFADQHHWEKRPGLQSPASQDTLVPELPPPPPPPQVVVNSREDVGNGSVLEMQRDTELKIDFLVLKHTLTNSDTLIIRLPLAAVAESASYASNFLAFTGLLAAMAGCAWAFLFAKKFTIPLLELSRVTHAISQLDFSQPCRISSNDEVGALAKSINHLSDQLNKAITELHQKNRQLLADVETERRLDKLRKNFTSSVSHELRTPISLILGYAEGLKENVAQSTADKNYYCSVIMDEAIKMEKLVKDLLDLSQIESGYFRLERTDFDLAVLLDEIILKYRTTLVEKSVTLQLETDPSLSVNGDVLRVEQVIVNLLNNALAHVEPPNQIRIAVTHSATKFRVSVYNTGKQIPPDSLDNLWLSFYKVDQARTREMGGYGLGLSIVRAIQELHGNTYGVENTAGGVLFWFEVDRSA